MESVSFKDLFDLCQVEAIASKLAPDELSIYRYYCRQYSKLFHTPLHVVQTMDPILVITEVIEDRLDPKDEFENVEQWLDVVYAAEDPAYESQRKQEEESYLAEAEEEEAERVRIGKPIHPSLKGETTLVPEKPTIPKSGGINMAAMRHLEKESQ